MNMKKIIPILSILLLATVAFARVHAYWSYDKLTKEADLIVIATPVSVQDTAERTTFPDIVQTDTNNVRRPVPAVGVETTFAVLSVLKGNTRLDGSRPRRRLWVVRGWSYDVCLLWALPIPRP